MCYNGHIGDVGITGNAPEWECNILNMRNRLLDVFYDAVPEERGFDIEKVVDPEFTEIDDLIYAIIDKLKRINQ
tara:strand:+ start:188 stop:409 length:222 start_codon:yes stop_codon:yes gene_type:complete